jgi:hypothetical protein
VTGLVCDLFLRRANNFHPFLRSQLIGYKRFISTFFLLSPQLSSDGIAFAQGRAVEPVSAYEIRQPVFG